MRKALFGMVIATLVVLNVLVVTVIMKQINDASSAKVEATSAQSDSKKESNKSTADPSADTVKEKKNETQEIEEAIEQQREESNSNDYETDETGTISGVITWQYNDVIGTKPDVGAKIVLLKPNPKEKYNVPLLAGSSTGELVHGNGVYEAKADGYGNYIINDIPVGEYIYIINSHKTTSEFDNKLPKADSDLIKQLLTEEQIKDTVTFLEIFNYKIGKVEIKNGKTTTISHDFGYTHH
ncbi:hypothetical protein [Paenibacillus agilis]|uniref:Uncharacterized protein n=1 Tax=Paenibacillus agilis TaxID=3020863 RepID=A0A559IGK5_9BACL|nr:hypothetical protein [Paenibacillus agilis]TVX86805.1 hypothetical protein FPZ44_23070 [Paenibacillus agilis]